MDILKVISFILVSLVLVLILEKTSKEYAVMLTIICSVIILTFVIVKLDGIITLLNDLVNKAGINKEYLTVLLKVTGIAYVVELTKNICVDAGSTALASKVELAGKVSIVILTIPILTSVISVVVNIV